MNEISKKKIVPMVAAGIAAVLLVASMNIFSAGMAQASNGIVKQNGPSGSYIPGNKAIPNGSDAGCTGNPHDFLQPKGNPHDFAEGKTTGNPHECPSQTITSISPSVTTITKTTSTVTKTTTTPTIVQKTLNVFTKTAGTNCNCTCPQIGTMSLSSTTLQQNSVIPLVSAGQSKIVQSHVSVNAPETSSLSIIVEQAGTNGIAHAAAVHLTKLAKLSSTESQFQSDIQGHVSGINPFTGQQDTVTSISDIMLQSSSTVTFNSNDQVMTSVLLQH